MLTLHCLDFVLRKLGYTGIHGIRAMFEVAKIGETGVI